MKGWIEGLQESIDYIEQHLTESIDMEEIAGNTGFSGDKSSFDVPAKKSLEPDLISVDKNGDHIDFIIFDAKYYNMLLNEFEKTAWNKIFEREPIQGNVLTISEERMLGYV